MNHWLDFRYLEAIEALNCFKSSSRAILEANVVKKLHETSSRTLNVTQNSKKYHSQIQFDKNTIQICIWSLQIIQPKKIKQV